MQLRLMVYTDIDQTETEEVRKIVELIESYYRATQRPTLYWLDSEGKV